LSNGIHGPTNGLRALIRAVRVEIVVHSALFIAKRSAIPSSSSSRNHWTSHGRLLIYAT
jgi:hypothetical protein